MIKYENLIYLNIIEYKKVLIFGKLEVLYKVKVLSKDNTYYCWKKYDDFCSIYYTLKSKNFKPTHFPKNKLFDNYYEKKYKKYNQEKMNKLNIFLNHLCHDNIPFNIYVNKYLTLIKNNISY